MKNLNQIKPGESIWLYIVEYTEECFPIVEKEYVLDLRPMGNRVRVTDVDKGKAENRIINNFDFGVSAHSSGKIYIWLSEKNFRKAFDITKKYFMEKLTKSTREVSRLCGIFSNMEGWIDIFSCEDELSKIPYADNPKKVLRYHVGSGPDLTEADEEVEE